jgi:hypothetical protein
METCTYASTRGTTLLPHVVLSAQPAGVVRRQAAPALGVTTPATAKQTRGRAASVRSHTARSFAGFTQGGAVAATSAAPVTSPSVIDLMVTDHPYSTRLGPFSCRPPV